MCICLRVCLLINKVNGNPQESMAHANDDCLIEISRETAAPCLSLHLFLFLFCLGCGMGCNSNYLSVRGGSESCCCFWRTPLTCWEVFKSNKTVQNHSCSTPSLFPIKWRLRDCLHIHAWHHHKHFNRELWKLYSLSSFGRAFSVWVTVEEIGLLYNETNAQRSYRKNSLFNICWLFF